LWKRRKKKRKRISAQRLYRVAGRKDAELSAGREEGKEKRKAAMTISAVAGIKQSGNEEKGKGALPVTTARKRDKSRLTSS